MIDYKLNAQACRHNSQDADYDPCLEADLDHRPRGRAGSRVPIG